MIVIEMNDLFELRDEIENMIFIAKKINKNTENMQKNFLALGLDEVTVNKIIKVLSIEELP